jgi:hypothetical protein
VLELGLGFGGGGILLELALELELAPNGLEVEEIDGKGAEKRV